MSEKKKISMRASGPEQNTDAEDARSKKRSVHGSEKLAPPIAYRRKKSIKNRL